jgi:hypothetical protein
MCIWHDGVEGSAPLFVFWMPMTLHDVAGDAHVAAHTSYARTHVRTHAASSHMHACPLPPCSLLILLPFGLYSPSFALIGAVVSLLRGCRTDFCAAGEGSSLVPQGGVHASMGTRAPVTFRIWMHISSSPRARRTKKIEKRWPFEVVAGPQSSKHLPAATVPCQTVT